MYAIDEGTTHNLPDVAAFIEALNHPAQNLRAEARSLFHTETEIIVTRAPGRLDVMGGIADYSGSLVLELPTREATFVALQRDVLRRLTIVSMLEDTLRESVFEMSLADFENGNRPVEYEVARTRFQ